MNRLSVVVLLAAFVLGVAATSGLVLLLVRNPPPAELLGFLGNLLGAVMASTITVAGAYFLFRYQQKHTGGLKLSALKSRTGPLKRLFETLANVPEGDDHNRWLNSVSRQQPAISAIAIGLEPDADFGAEINEAVNEVAIAIDILLGVEAITQVSTFRLSHAQDVAAAAKEASSKLDRLRVLIDV